MKRKILLVLIFGSLIYSAYSQNEDCSCKNDLAFLDSKIRKTPAFKINKEKYTTAYSKALKEVTSTHTIYDCYALLSELLLSLNDNHSRVYSLDLGATSDVISSSEKFGQFQKSNLFNSYLAPDINLDSLKTALRLKDKSDIEGVYFKSEYLTIGLYKNESRYEAIVLDSKTDVWLKGELLYTFIPYGNDYFLGIGGGLSSKRLISYTEKIENGFFYFMGFQKDSSQTNHSIKTLSDSTYYREELSDNITYLKIGSFNSWNPTLRQAEEFYKTLEGNLKKDNLVIDLRNNGGGGERNSNIIYKLIKQYTKKGKVYVLINHRTVSQAEQFAHRLSKLKNCQLFGMRTNGTLAFEIKDSSYNLPCGDFVVVLTSKKHSTYLDFESVGIKPAVVFNNEEDWISQLEKYIADNN